jgi:2-haloalkanoic acid dehalogenase type II
VIHVRAFDARGKALEQNLQELKRVLDIDLPVDEWAKEEGIADEELLAAFGRAESRREAADPTAPYPRILAGVLEDLAQELGATASGEEAAAFGDSVKDWPVFPDTPDALAYLKRHYKLVIVSNVDRASFRHSNAKLGVTFDAVVTADDAGAYKPAHNHFRLALAKLADMGVPRDRVLHVAQSLYHDHVPAKAGERDPG